MKKKILALITVVSLLMSIYSVSLLVAHGAGDPTIVVSSENAIPGDEGIKITVSLENNPGIIMLGFSVHYDSARLELTEVKNEGMLPLYATISTLSSNPYNVTWNGFSLPENMTDDGAVLTLTFKVKSTASSGLGAVSVSYIPNNILNKTPASVTFATVSGGINVLCDHTVGDWEIKTAPTCTSEGLKVKKCTVCDDVVESEVIPAAGHTYGEWHVETPAECGVAGEECRHCFVCSHEDKRPITALTHIEGEWEILLAPGCETSGTRVKKCTLCHEVLQSESVSALGHSWSGWTTVTLPTFSVDGLEKCICSVCHDEETRPIPKLEDSHVHDYSGTETVVTPATCTADGSKNVFCTEPECGAYKTVTVPATDHTIGGWEVKTTETCTTDGLRVKKCTVCHVELDTEIIPATGHGYGAWSVKTSATCTIDGVEHRICSACSHEDTRPITAKGHTPGDWEITTPPTCTVAGEETIKCADCGATLNAKAVSATYHIPGEWETALVPTCETSGTKVKKCTVCGDVVQSESLDALGHNFGGWTTVTSPTFTTAGLEKRTCSVCLDEETRAIPKLSDTHTHDYSGTETVVTLATCTAGGSKNVFCTELECGAYKTVSIPALGHTHGEWEVKTPATCTTDGLCVKKCTVCGEELETQIIAATGHSFGEWYPVTPATCTTDGLEQRDCASTDESETRIIAALGHSFGGWTTVTPPTFSVDGLEKRTCSACHADETRPIAKLSDSHVHDYSGIETVVTPAACTADGSKNVFCTEPECGAYQTVSIPALGHTHGEGEVKIPATCTADGLRVKKCTVCDETIQTEMISALGHDWSAWEIVIPATFTTDGSEKRICSVCDEEETRRIPKLSETHTHDFTGREEIITHATCTVDGSKKVHCTDPECEEFIIASIPAKGHTPGEWEITKAATENETGLKERKCTVCGEKIESAAIPKLSSGSGQSDVPKTGDNSRTSIHIVLLIISLGVLISSSKNWFGIWLDSKKTT